MSGAYKREEFSPTVLQNDEDTPPPLPPRRPEDDTKFHSAKADRAIKVTSESTPSIFKIQMSGAYRKEEFSPTASENDEDTPPPLPPRQPEENLPHSAPASTHIKQQGFGFGISEKDVQRTHKNIHESGSHTSQWKGHSLDKRNSANVNEGGTIFHSTKAHHAIKITSESASSSCEGQFGARSNRDEGYPTSTESTPYHSGGATFSTAEDHLNYKYVSFDLCVHVCVHVCMVCVCVCVCVCGVCMWCVCVCVCVCVCACVHASMHVCMHA